MLKLSGCLDRGNKKVEFRTLITKDAMGYRREERWMRVELEATDDTDTTEYHGSQLHHLKQILTTGVIAGGKKTGDRDVVEARRNAYTTHSIQGVMQYLGPNTFKTKSKNGEHYKHSAKVFFEVRNIDLAPNDPDIREPSNESCGRTLIPTAFWVSAHRHTDNKYGNNAYKAYRTYPEHDWEGNGQ